MDVLFSLSGLFSLLGLVLLEIVLGVDNIIFIALITEDLPAKKAEMARKIGLVLALLIRIGLLFSISFLIGLRNPVAEISWLKTIGADPVISVRDVILFFGGAFLLFQSVKQIIEKIQYKPALADKKKQRDNFYWVIAEIIFIDVIFSIDSILTAIGLVQNLAIMVAAVVISMFVMLIFAGKVAQILKKHMRIKILGLLFLVFIGLILILESIEIAVPKTYLYFAIFFSIVFERINFLIENNEKKSRHHLP